MVIAGAVSVGALAVSLPAPARAAGQSVDAVANPVRLDDLPDAAVTVHRQIQAGGPFLHPEKDGVVFANRERLLPRETRGYYREYTVPTPGSRDRGARRIVCGGREPKTPDVCYYTQDHYASFRRIAP
jgi:ribonuclease T1